MTTLKLSDFTPQDLCISNPQRSLHHIFEQDDCNALWAAYAANRPLLLRGAPGTGKSQMARAIAEQLGWGFVKEVIHGSTELSDLHWHFDAIARLGEAQVQSSDNAKREERLNPLNFLSPGGFWWAYHWTSAQQQYDQCKTRLRAMPETPDPNTPQGQSWKSNTGGVVLLLDEIDKADPDLPNGLLETLGDYCFTVPYLSSEAPKSINTDDKPVVTNPVKANPDRVLVVITTNEEREVPTAFLRRCFVHTLKMESSQEKEPIKFSKKEETLVEKRYAWLIKRGQLHFGNAIDSNAYLQAAKLIWQDHSIGNHYNPGLAEYIDLLRVLHKLEPQEQRQRLDLISTYAIQKALL